MEIKNSGTFCPYCGKQTISYSQQFDPTNGQPIVVGTCQSCNQSWQAAQQQPIPQQVIVQQTPKKKSHGGMVAAVIIGLVVLIGIGISNGRSKKASDVDTSGNTTTASTTNSEATENTATQAETAAPEPEIKTEYRVGETWTVEGNWSLTINSVELTDERNQFDHHTPVEVYYIDYTYENLGYKSRWIKDDTLTFTITSKVVDNEGYTGYSYPNDVTYPEPAPQGAKCKVRSCIGVDNAGPVKLIVTHVDSDGKDQTVTFIIGE